MGLSLLKKSKRVHQKEEANETKDEATQKEDESEKDPLEGFEPTSSEVTQVGLFDGVLSTASSAGAQTFASTFATRLFTSRVGWSPKATAKEIAYEAAKDGAESATVASFGQITSNFLKKYGMQGSTMALSVVTESYFSAKTLYNAYRTPYEESQVCRLTAYKISQDSRFMESVMKESSVDLVRDIRRKQKQPKKCCNLSSCTIL